MAYNRQPQTVLAGTALKQNPPPSIVQPAGIIPVTLDADIATTTDLGVVQVGSGLSITPSGVLSATGGGSATIGTWTPTIAVSTAGTVTLTVNSANYSKVGQQVICYFDVNVATKAGGANANTLTMNGLPFTSINGVVVAGSLVVTIFANLNVSSSYLTGTVIGNSTSVPLYSIHNDSDNTRLTYQAVQAGDDPTRLVGTITYLSAT